MRMQLTVSTLWDTVFTLEVGGDLDIKSFKGLCEIEVGIPANEIILVHNGRSLHDENYTLTEYNINNGDILLLQQFQGHTGRDHSMSNEAPTSLSASSIDFGSIHIPGASRRLVTHMQQSDDLSSFRQMLLSNPHQLALLKGHNPMLADALDRGLDSFIEVYREQEAERRRTVEEMDALSQADPIDPEVQSRIAEMIRLKNVNDNMESAVEHAPETFGQVFLLYVNCTVNGFAVKAAVDSGAQVTIMSQACAERCQIMRLVNRRLAGVAKGVGTQNIIGRVHLCQIQIGDHFFQSAFSILEDQPMDMLLGLDMLKCHQCIIDLKRNVLVFGSTGTETPFLSEADLPEHALVGKSWQQ